MANRKKKSPQDRRAPKKLPDMPDVSTAQELYRQTRSGARSARGFHFQDAIGAWLATEIYCGVIAGAVRVVPEDWEDLTIEGKIWTHVQVKSRQESRGFFTAGELTTFVNDLWKKHLQRVHSGVRSDALLLVLERPVTGDQFKAGQNRRLEELACWRNIEEIVSKGFPNAADLTELLSMTSVQVIDENSACSEAQTDITSFANTYPAAAAMSFQAIRQEIVRSTDSNSTSVLDEGRVGLTGSDISRLVEDTLALVDFEALDEAIRYGDCETIDFVTVDSNEAFYEGIATQPSHVAAGLATPRPDITNIAIRALSSGSNVLLGGPSGVGKSTAMWLTAKEATEFLWYRVKPSADVASVQRILRMVRGLAPTPERSVGLVFDGVDHRQVALWDALVTESAPISGLVMLGSARSEDLYLIETSTSSEVIEVSLDEETAKNIHQHLLESGSTTVSHWREAYDLADGLTMEFTHILSKGERLETVVTAQVNQRIRESRNLEVEIIALVATADQWGASIEFSSLSELVNADPNDLRVALERLTREHVLQKDHDRLRGLHQLRSSFLSLAVHSTPPPLLRDTIGSLISSSAPTDLKAIVVGALSHRAIRDNEAIGALTQRLSEESEYGRRTVLLSVMDALREVEYQRRVSSWTKILDKEKVPLPLRASTIQFSMVEDFSVPNMMEEIQRALPQLSPLTTSTFTLGSLLVDHLAPGFVEMLLVDSDSIAKAIGVLETLLGTSMKIAESVESLLAGSRFEDALTTISVEELGELFIAAYALEPALYHCLISYVGGNDAVLTRLKQQNPWITEAEATEEDSELVPRVRAMYISEVLQSESADKSNQELAKTVARLFPTVHHVDVQTLFPGDIPIKFGDHDLAISLLQNRYMHSSVSVSWRRKIMAIAASAYSAPSKTERTMQATSLLQSTSRFLMLLGIVWSRGSNRQRDIEHLKALREEVVEDLSQFSAFIPPEVDPDAVLTLTADPLYNLVNGVFTNFTDRLLDRESNKTMLAAFARSNLRKSLEESKTSESWSLVEFDPSDVYSEIDRLLADFATVLQVLDRDPELLKSVRAAARGGESKRSLSRAARVCVRTLEKRRRESLRQLQQSLLGHQFSVSMFTKDGDRDPYAIWPPYRLLVTVEIRSVLEWNHAVEALFNIVSSHFDDVDQPPAIWCIPMISNKPIKQLCVRFTDRVVNDSDEADDWLEEVGEAYNAPLHNIIAGLINQLDALSALAFLGSRRETASLQEQAEACATKFGDLYTALQAMSADDSRVEPFVEWIDSQLNRIQAELNRQGTLSQDDPEYLIVEKIRALTTPESASESDTFSEAIFCILTALQYDIDPENLGLAGC